MATILVMWVVLDVEYENAVDGKALQGNHCKLLIQGYSRAVA